MQPTTDDQVVDFFYNLFDRIFATPFRPQITERLRRDAVMRQIQETNSSTSFTATRRTTCYTSWQPIVSCTRRRGLLSRTAKALLPRQ
jgi:hypothetical protein